MWERPIRASPGRPRRPLSRRTGSSHGGTLPACSTAPQAAAAGGLGKAVRAAAGRRSSHRSPCRRADQPGSVDDALIVRRGRKRAVGQRRCRSTAGDRARAMTECGVSASRIRAVADIGDHQARRQLGERPHSSRSQGNAGSPAGRSCRRRSSPLAWAMVMAPADTASGVSSSPVASRAGKPSRAAKPRTAAAPALPPAACRATSHRNSRGSPRP